MIDPYATLGLPSGASLDEVKRAYRALAKRYHPDSAGEAATARFLAIQAAYEALTSPSRGPGRASRGPSGSGTPARPSAADPERARATREAYRSRRTWPGAGSTGSSPAGSSPPGSGPPRPGAAGQRPNAGSTSSADGQAGPGPARSSTAPGGGRRRAGRVASLGSTSYDDAVEWEPEWSGGTWYGASSGTHWTVNPREYADPRKHGPEYLARARRRVEHADAQARTGARAGPEPEAEPQAASAAPEPEPRPAPPRPQRVTFEDRPSAGAMAGGSSGAAVIGRTTPIPGRVLAALIAWPPLGYLAALAVGEASGCARYAAGCTEEASLAAWAVQPLILALLLLLPSIARPAAVGSMALLVAAIPAAAAFSASAGNRGPSRETITLFLAIVVMGYAVAFVGAATDRIPLPAWLRPRGAGA